MSDRLKIAQCTTVHPRADTRILVKQSRSLANRFKSTALFVGDGLSDSVETDTGLKIYDIGSNKGRNRLVRMVRQPAKMLKLIWREKPIVAHIHDPELIPVALILKALGQKIVYDVHEDLPQQILSKHWIPRKIRPIVSATAKFFERAAAEAFDAIVAATPTIAQKFPQKTTIVVQNFPLLSEFATTPDTPYAQRPQAITYIGGITKVRGALEMIESLDHLHDLPDFKLHLAGKIDQAPLAQTLKSMPGWQKVHDHGFVDRHQVTNILSKVRAGLVLLHPTPAYLESLPVKMFEYMAAGLPVIASDFPLWRKIIEDAQCGLLVDPHKPDDIAQAIRWILNNPDKAFEMGARGRSSIAQKYNWQFEAEKLFSLYDKLLNENNTHNNRT